MMLLGHLAEIGAAGAKQTWECDPEENFARFERDGQPDVVIIGLTVEEARALAQHFMTVVSITVRATK